MINVTKTFLPSIEEYNQYLQRAWNNQWLTNRGELVKELEQKLQNYLFWQRPILRLKYQLFLHFRKFDFYLCVPYKKATFKRWLVDFCVSSLKVF